MSGATILAKLGKLVFPCGPDKRPLVKWRECATTDLDQISDWRERWPNAMIGLPCGAANNLFVIDLDTHKETGQPLGAASLAELGYSQLLEGPRVQTPSGGMHIYFQHWPGGRNTVGNLGPGIDTRTEGGYVIAAGSHCATGRYLGDPDWSALPKLPLGLRARATQPQRAPAPRHNEPACPGEIQELLGHVPSDCDYQTWVTALMALHDRFRGSEDGLAIADAWSAQGSKYRPGEVAAKWRSFKRSGVSFASLPAIARDHGANLSEIARKHRRAAHG